MQSRSRAGFTLIELMVSMALTLVIMTILAQSFVLALDIFSGLKGLGDMQQNLRTAAILLRSDLGSDHFDGSRRLSDASVIDPNFPIQAGFFTAAQGSPPATTNPSPYFIEGLDQNGMLSARAINHVLYFTVKRKGNRQENFFTTVLQDYSGGSAVASFFANQTAYNVTPGQLSVCTLTPPYIGGTTGVYGSQWAEVLYYLVPTGTTTDPSIPGGIPTYSLYRTQFVMVSEGTNLSGLIPNSYDPKTLPTFQGLSCNAGTKGLTFYSPERAAKGGTSRTISNLTVTDPRFVPGSLATTLVLPNVISFQVEIMPTTMTSFMDVPNPDINGISTYDTTQFNASGYLNTFGLRAIQITMRVWDVNTRQTRQTTVIQDL